MPINGKSHKARINSRTKVFAMTVHTLQNFVFPDIENANALALFIRWQEGVPSIAGKDNTLSLIGANKLDLATYYNGFSLAKWRKIADLGDLGLKLETDGACLLRVMCHFEATGPVCIHQELRDASKQDDVVWFDGLNHLDGVLLSVEIETQAGTQTKLVSGAWVTETAPVRDVNIAAVITTFGREEEVQRSIRYFAETIMPYDQAGVGQLFVIDNGRALAPQDYDGVTVIQNPNLGGAGGFTRGLLEAKDDGGFTHVLFMDDDANCQAESVWRTAAVFRYARDPDLAISGAMLLEGNPTCQHEKSATFPQEPSHRPFLELHGNGMNMADLGAVKASDLMASGNYGAWWFFGFALSAVKTLPFPFFVRGDDIDFSLVNKFPVETLNGIATQCPDFDTKRTPPVAYLEARSTMALALMHATPGRVKILARRLVRHAVALGYRFDYGSMEASLSALEELCKGPSVFGDAPAPTARLGELKKLFNAQEVGREEIGTALHRGPVRRKLAHFISRMTWNGHLLPNFLIRNATVLVDDSSHFDRAATYRARFAAYGRGETVKLFERDNARMWAGKRRARALYKELKENLEAIQADFQTHHHQYRGTDYWMGLFADGAPAAPAPNPTPAEPVSKEPEVA